MEKEEEIKKLRLEVMNQWFTNHAEHCGKLPAWPHNGRCHWPMPEVLPPTEVYLLLLEVSGVSYGLRLQGTGC